MARDARSRQHLPRSLLPVALYSKLPLSRKPTSPKPSKRATPSARAASPSIIPTASTSSLPPAASTKSPNTACTPPPNPPLTENWPRSCALRSAHLCALCVSAFSFLLFVYDATANDGGDSSPFESTTIEGGIARLARRFFHVVSPGMFGRENRQVRWLARGDLSFDGQNTRRARRKQLHHPHQRKPPGVDQLFQRQRQRRFETKPARPRHPPNPRAARTHSRHSTRPRGTRLLRDTRTPTNPPPSHTSPHSAPPPVLPTRSSLPHPPHAPPFLNQQVRAVF